MNTPTTSEHAAALSALIDAGLTFGECVKAFAARQDESDYADRARDEYHEEGSIEIDANAIVSEGDDGAYVMAWVWVGDDGDADEDEHEEGDGCASYDTGYQVRRRGGGTIDVEDLKPGDSYQDPAMDDPDTWYEVTDVHVMPDGQTVHVESGDE